MKARVEPFGAWVRLDQPPTLVAVDQARARRLGLDGGDLWKLSTKESTAPLEVHLAVNNRCGVGCEGCYLDATPQGAAPSFDELVGRLSALEKAGVFTVALGGGEPLLRRDLGALAHEARRLGLTPVMTTSGVGLTPERARELTAFAQVNVSHDGVGGGYARVRGVDAAQSADRAISLLAEAGIRVGINLVLTRHNFAVVEETAKHVAALGAREIQLLRYKPAGRAASLTYLERRLDREQRGKIPELLATLVREAGVSVRIDCAMVPWLSMSSVDPVAMERFGVFGCEAGRHLVAGTVDGEVAPCSFLPGVGLSLSDLAEGFSDPQGLAAIRAHVTRAPEPCASCSFQRVCRGGCRAVAAWYGDPIQPDPECPRVESWRNDETS